MKISACVIVKNEEKNIGQWLNNMRQIADEIVVVDTGSTDNTINILENANITPYHFTWCNDFAAAKNYAIQQATGEWIVFLDADEYFDASSVQRFRTEMTRYHANKKIGAIMCQLVNIDTDNRNKIIDTMIQVRIFRNSKDIYYKNPVHEQLVTKPGKYIMQKCYSLTIMHTGYSATIVRQKSERNLPILKQKEKMAVTKKDKGESYLFLMDAYNCLGNYDKVKEYAQKAIENGIVTLGNAIHPYTLLITAMINLDMDKQEIIAEIERAREKFPKEPFFLIQLGHYCYIKHDFWQAERYLNRALKLRKDVEESIRKGNFITDTSLNLVPVLYGYLGDICMRKGDIQGALEMSLQGMEYYKYNHLLTKTLYKSLLRRSAVEIIQIFDCFYNRKEDGEFLKEALGWQVSGEFAAYYYPVDNAVDEVKLYVKTGKYQGGIAAAGQQLNMLNHISMAAALTQKEDGARKLPESFGIMPAKYKQLASFVQTCQQDEDGRAAIRLKKQLKYLQEE